LQIIDIRDMICATNFDELDDIYIVQGKEAITAVVIDSGRKVSCFLARKMLMRCCSIGRQGSN